ncbi:FAD-dependent oxidoreductase [Woeseia oceani]|uniref:FAD dependent oxidoreductase domain-containing protein n=1 Tax=Woeseia oceani TaxID=1548547 RepID=A0A193LCK1_9GAMM|nr:FAD-dependent oxidoreductase [Woeseia oceani]ANO50265.1 hypothetical protein BA177_02665 [Woeseia oceani]
MHVVVLGAGIAGVTSAYSLALRGYEVTVIDRANAVAAGASHANGGQLSYSFTDALARPSFLPGIPGLLLGRDPATRVRLLTRPWLPGWGLRFLRQCTHKQARNNTIAVLELAMRSAHRMAMISEQTGVSFAHKKDGKLVLLPEGADLEASRQTISLKKRHGCTTELLSMADAIALEPAIEAMAGRYAAALYSAQDETGDARVFAEGLAGWLQRNKGMNLRLGETVNGLLRDGARIVGVQTSKGEMTADAVVVCLGARSPDILRDVGISVPVYPVRGYSLSVPRGSAAPRISITDLKRRILFSPLADRMRVSGFADFVGFSDRDDAARIALLRKMASETAPLAALYDHPQSSPWAGSRPMTPDGRPITGASDLAGLFLNCGHGMLGWTLAAATADDLAEVMAQSVNSCKPPAKSN